jgi:hypothetical protein
VGPHPESCAPSQRGVLDTGPRRGGVEPATTRDEEAPPRPQGPAGGCPSRRSIATVGDRVGAVRALTGGLGVGQGRAARVGRYSFVLHAPSRSNGTKPTASLTSSIGRFSSAL